MRLCSNDVIMMSKKNLYIMTTITSYNCGLQFKIPQLVKVVQGSKQKGETKEMLKNIKTLCVSARTS